MCDTNKFFEIFEDINKLTASDTMQLIEEAKDRETREFYVMVGNYLLQKKQKKVIERNLF